MRAWWLMAVVGFVAAALYALAPSRTGTSHDEGKPWTFPEVRQMLTDAGASIEPSPPSPEGLAELEVGESEQFFFSAGDSAGGVYIYDNERELEKYWEVDERGDAEPRLFIVTDVVSVVQDNVVFSVSAWALRPALDIVNQIRAQMDT